MDWFLLKEKELLLFLKKKKQKDFFESGRGVLDERHRPRFKEVFCAAFFQKSCCLLT